MITIFFVYIVLFSVRLVLSLNQMTLLFFYEITYPSDSADTVIAPHNTIPIVNIPITIFLFIFKLSNLLIYENNFFRYVIDSSVY